jgi:eukaryotic-like serine/threonine-protein kinase
VVYRGFDEDTHELFLIPGGTLWQTADLSAQTGATPAYDANNGLAQAHTQGVFHRDLKPGNIMITESGPKLLDFGLAKLREREGLGSGSAVVTQTASSELTQPGTILGTLQYMAPEQLEGKEADARTDIFALGAVLYEMATGRKVFDAKSRASLIEASTHFVSESPVGA